MNRENYISQIETVISSMQLANKTIANSYGSKLGLLELAVLSEIKNNPNISSHEIANRTHSSAVRISRCIGSLQKSALVQKGPRNKQLKIIVTKRGWDFFTKAYSLECEVFRKAYERLPKNLYKSFENGIKQINNKLQASQAVRLDEDPPFLSEIRRLTRVLGFLSGNPYNFKQITSLEWHILRAFYAAQSSSKTLNAKTIARQFAISQQTIFSVLQRMEKLSYIRKTPTLDGREKALVICNAGEILMENFLTHARSLLRFALADLSDDAVKKLSEAGLFFAGLEKNSQQSQISPTLSIIFASTKNDFYLARKIVYKSKVLNNSLEKLAESVCSYESKVGIICKHRVGLAVIELNKGFIVNFASIPKALLKSEIKAGFESFISEVGAHKFISQTELKNNCTSECWNVISDFIDK
jgi:DNA-binding MarR family transcriptional regulator